MFDQNAVSTSFCLTRIYYTDQVHSNRIQWYGPPPVLGYKGYNISIYACPISLGTLVATIEI
jgi:hypothetical protein